MSSSNPSPTSLLATVVFTQPPATVLLLSRCPVTFSAGIPLTACCPLPPQIQLPAGMLSTVRHPQVTPVHLWAHYPLISQMTFLSHHHEGLFSLCSTSSLFLFPFPNCSSYSSPLLSHRSVEIRSYTRTHTHRAYQCSKMTILIRTFFKFWCKILADLRRSDKVFHFFVTSLLQPGRWRHTQTRETLADYRSHQWLLSLPRRVPTHTHPHTDIYLHIMYKVAAYVQ